MTTLTACPICGSPRPANRTGDQPWCCSIVCYRTLHGIDQPHGEEPVAINELVDQHIPSQA